MNVKNLRISILLILFISSVKAQVGIGNTDPQSSLDISASSITTPANNDGILIPRMSTFPPTPGATRDGMLIFYTGIGADGKGFYYWDQTITNWVFLKGTNDHDWYEVSTSSPPNDINDNIFTQGDVAIGLNSPNAKLHIDGGTTPFRIDRSGTEKLSFRNNALEFHNNGGSIFIGEDAGLNDDLSTKQNIAIGYSALRSNVNQNQNIAIGNNSLRLNTNGEDNIAIGDDAMSSSIGGRSNVSLGVQTLYTNVSGNNNVAIGSTSLRSNISSDNNVAIGFRSLYNTMTGGASIALGFDAGYTNTSGQNNVYLGNNSGYLNTGSNNVFLGYNSGYNETGSHKLYIDNSNVATPLIYGEFDNNLLRANGEFQIGIPTGTGYAFPLIDGSVGQLFTTDGNGQLSFVDPNSIFSNDHDWYEEGSTNQPDDINDNIYTQGNVGIGQNTPISPLHIGISTPFDLDHTNIGQDGIFIVGLGDNSGTNAVGGSISFGPPHSTRGDHRKSAISSVQTSNDSDHTGLAFYVHGNAINQSPMTEGMRLTHQRYLGINNTDPSANLDVIGTMQFEDGNEAVGYVLASDATGNATWTDPNTLIMGVERINDLIDGKSDIGGSQDGSSLFLGIDAGAADDSSDNRNVGIGYLALEDNTIGSQNTAVGYNALLNNTEGTHNTAIGSASLDANTTGIWNTAVGHASLSTNVGGSYNTALGRGSLGANAAGNSNVTVGVWALSNSTSGSFNTVIGTEAGNALSGESSNTIIGRRAMNSYTAGGDNVAIGAGAGYYGSGIQNTFIGTNTGNSVGTGERNGSVFLGYGAGSLEASSNKLYIENSTSTTPLIYGEFDTNILRANGEFQIGNPTVDGYAFPTTDSANSGDVLTTDSNGVVTWTTPTEVDGDVTNELQDLTLTGDELQISGGTSASMRAFINPKYPDGFANIDPITFDNLVGSNRYTVPAGKNLYITNLFNNHNSADLTIEDAGAFFRHGNHHNTSDLQTINSPIIVGSGAIVETDLVNFKINGFLVDAYCEPIIINASYTVPVGKILVILNYRSFTASDLTVAGVTIYNGRGTDTNTAGLTSFMNPIFVDSGESVNSSAASYDINGYLIDK